MVRKSALAKRAGLPHKEGPMKRQIALLLVLVAVLQWTVPLLPLAGLGQTIGEQAVEGGRPPELPPGVFFSIWSVIFLLYTVFAVLAVTKPRYLERHLAIPLLAAGAGNVVWMLAAQFLGNDTLNLVLIVPILLFAWEASHRMHRMGGFDGTWRRLNAAALTGLLSGWATVALSISLPRVVRHLRGLAPTDDVWISLWIALITAGLLTWLYAARVSRGLFFFVALSWGLAGIAANNWYVTGMGWLAAATVLAWGIILWQRLTKGARDALR